MKIIILTLSILIGLLGSLIKYNEESVEDKVAKHVVKLQDNGGSGTGFYIAYKNKSFLISNKHVCGESDSMYINKKLVKVLVISKIQDICLLESDRIGGLKLAEKPLIRFQRVHTIGHPLGQDLTVRRGTMITKIHDRFPWIRREPVDALHLELTVFGGNSGSPLVNDDGEIVGLVFGTNQRTFHDAYAVPLEDLKAFLDEIIN